MSEIIIVDEKDKIIGYKEIDDVKMKDIYRVSALWIRNSQGKVLLEKRSPTKKNNPGRWSPGVSGTVEKGETYESNIIKEAEEELGIKNLNIEKSIIIRVYGKHNYFSRWFIITINKTPDDLRIQEEEISEIKWFSLGELKKRIKSNADEFTEGLKLFVAKL